IAMSEVIDWRLILSSFTFSNQEYHEKKDQYVKSRASRKKRINMSNQEHHEKKGSICQIKCAPTIAHMCHCQPHDCNVRRNRLETNPSLFIFQIKSTTK